MFSELCFDFEPGFCKRKEVCYQTFFFFQLICVDVIDGFAFLCSKVTSLSARYRRETSETHCGEIPCSGCIVFLDTRIG